MNRWYWIKDDRFSFDCDVMRTVIMNQRIIVINDKFYKYSPSVIITYWKMLTVKVKWRKDHSNFLLLLTIQTICGSPVLALITPFTHPTHIFYSTITQKSDHATYGSTYSISVNIYEQGTNIQSTNKYIQRSRLCCVHIIRN